MRDTKDDYRRALVEEYEAYQRAGRTDDAKHVAEVLRDEYDHEVDDGAPEHTAKERPPEDTAVKPARRSPRGKSQG